MSYCKKHKQKYDTSHCPICEGEIMGEEIVDKRWATTKIFTCIARHEKFQGSPEVVLTHYQCLARIFHSSVGCAIDCEKAEKMFTNDDHYDTSDGFNMDFVNKVLHPNGYSLKAEPQTDEESDMAAKKKNNKKATTPAKKKTAGKTKTIAENAKDLPKKPKGKGIGAFVIQGLKDGSFKGMKPKEIAEKVAAKFDSNTSGSSISWYINKMKKDGTKINM